MIIAVNTIGISLDKTDYKSLFIKEVFERIAQQNQFFFIFNKLNKDEFISSKKITLIPVKSALQNKLALKCWYDIKLPIALKKHKPDLLIQMNGICSTTISTPQLLMLTDNISTKKNIVKAKQIIVSSQFLKNQIVEKYQVDNNKINVIYGGASSNFKPLNFDEIMQTKEGYTDAREYFLFNDNTTSQSNVMNVLKAFSSFKKWQRSNMKLLIVKDSNDTEEKLKTYKFRDDVVLLNDVSENQLTRLTASAYCVLYPSFSDGFPLQILQAMQSSVPVIASNAGNMIEIGDEAILYVKPNSPEEIAEKMQLIYKDENLKSKLSKEGLQQALKFNWDKAAESFWDVIKNTN